MKLSIDSHLAVRVHISNRHGAQEFVDSPEYLAACCCSAGASGKKAHHIGAEIAIGQADISVEGRSCNVSDQWAASPVDMLYCR